MGEGHGFDGISPYFYNEQKCSLNMWDSCQKQKCYHGLYGMLMALNWFLGEKCCKTMTNYWILEMGQNVQIPTVWFNYIILKISQNHQICWPIGAQILAQSQCVVECDMSEITSPQTNQTNE